MKIEIVFDGIVARIAQEVSQATNHIYVVAEWITNKIILEALLSSASKGVQINLMLSNDSPNILTDHSQFSVYDSSMYYIERDEIAFMNKVYFLIADSTVITGRFNWTYQVETDYESIIIKTGDEFLTKSMIKQFECMRNKYFNADGNENNLGFPTDKIVKCFKILKLYIALRDTDYINRELEKLKNYCFQKDIDEIYTTLNNNLFDEALELINRFITMVQYRERVADLRHEIRQIEYQLYINDSERVEVEKLILRFYYLHNKELGRYISRLLFLHKTAVKSNAVKHAKVKKSEQSYNEYVQKQSKQIIFDLNAEKRFNIKKNYRRANQICHQNHTNNEFRATAQDILIELNTAYMQNDYIKVENIYEYLQQSVFDKNYYGCNAELEKVNKVEQLKKTIDALKHKNMQLKLKTSFAKLNLDYQKIIQISDWSKYFEKKKTQLLVEIEYLEKELRI